MKRLGKGALCQLSDPCNKVDLDDLFVHNGELYPNGRLIHDMYLLEVRSPDEIGDSQEYFKLEATVPAETAFQPLSATTCPLVSSNG